MTLKEIARMADVSPSAVSRYLNGGSLSAAKRAAISRVIEHTGYVPNQVAHTLRTGRVKQVGVIVPRIYSRSVSQVVDGINMVLSQAGYFPVLGSTGEKPEQEVRYLEMMQAYHMAGAIAMATTVTPAQAEVYRGCTIPLVITGQNFSEMNCVYHDDFNAMRELAMRMLARGRRKICYIGVSETDPAVGMNRRKGVQAALASAGLAADEMPVSIAAFDMESGRACMRQLLERCPEADGVACATDTIAHGALIALREAGRRVPEDVSIVSVGDDWADLVSVPQMTTARLYQTECGRDAATILLQMIDGEGQSVPARQIMLGYTIFDRGSV